MFLMRKSYLYPDIWIQLWANLKKIDHLHLVYHFAVFLNRSYHFKYFKRYLLQILSGPFLNALFQMWPNIRNC